MENKKYILTDDVIKFEGRKLYRIKAVRDFSDVKEGDLGGYIESEKNLSHEGDCWVYDNAMVMDDSILIGGAKVNGNVIICNDDYAIKNGKYAIMEWLMTKLKYIAKVLCLKKK